MGMSDFFALEAGEYLERLDGLLQGTGTPAIEELVRLARALRGSALMASQAAIARSAGGLETLVRGVREGRVAWDAGTRQLATRAVDDLKVFVRHVNSWSEADAAKADALASQLERTGGRASAQVRAAEALGLDAGARAFVAREGAAIASALDRASQTLRANPRAGEPLQAVLRAVQPLRGLAALNDLPPLPDLLDGIDRAIAETARSPGPVPDVADLFAAAARAIAQSAREVAERGRPDPEGADFKRFAQRLVPLLEADAPVVPIETLYHGDQGPHVLRRGTPAARPATLGRLELVSHGEHLRQAADSLERAPSPTQRELRAHSLAGTFRALAEASGGPLADAVSRFAHQGRDAVLSGLATRDPSGFATQLRRAADVLAGSSSADETALAARLDQVTRALRVAAPPPGTAAPAPPDQPAPTAARASVTVETPVPETADLVGSWATYQRLVASGIGEPSLTELLSGNGEQARITTARPAPAAPPPATPVFAVDLADADVVDIRTLLFRGERALARARELRAEAQRGGSPEQLRALVEEVVDLVALALEPGA
jgi:chemotaxis protein histidine kinase CheA